MKYAKEVLDNVSNSFMKETEEIMQKLLKRYGVIYYTELCTIDGVTMPQTLVALTAVKSLGLSDALYDILDRYNSFNNGQVLFHMMPSYPETLKVYCKR